MRKLALGRFATLLSALAFYACGSVQTTVNEEKRGDDLWNALEMGNFLFKASYAYPSGYKSMYLSPYYEVKVSPDTVKVYLPYYGRAYRAPMDPREGGYRFASTDFEYRPEKPAKKGTRSVTIDFHDVNRPVTFRFDIWENGTARLSVNDTDRQPISFQGDLVFRK